jgi:hypothetical protein
VVLETSGDEPRVRPYTQAIRKARPSSASTSLIRIAPVHRAGVLQTGADDVALEVRIVLQD